MADTSSKRELYRIVYPIAERPLFQIGRYMHEVVDASERGIRYEPRDREFPVVGTLLTGVLHFRRGLEVEVEGTVLRLMPDTNSVVMSLEPPLSFADIMAEQRYLRSRGYLLRES